MKNGGGWVGFHAAAYNDRHTNWPWLLEFLGGGVFLCNNWPPQPVLLELDTQDHQVTKNLPKEFVAPASEWYQWNPSPRDNDDIQVLASLSPKNYPLGIKDIVYSGDWPVVWTNRNYRMIYLNMGHGDEEYIDATQNLLFVNAFRWVVSQDPDGDPFDR
jgi:type 1 glutamine amidotransferase